MMMMIGRGMQGGGSLKINQAVHIVTTVPLELKMRQT